MARQLQGIRSRLEAACQRIAATEAALCQDAATALVAAHQAHCAARQAVQLASATLFSGEPLPDVGSDVWRSLWQAARAYSEQSAYPGQPYPVTRDDARCVLCQQPLGEDAAARLQRFDEFIKDESERLAAEAAERCREKLEAVQAASWSRDEIVQFVALIRDDLGDEALAEEVRGALVQFLWRGRALVRRHKDEALPAWPALGAAPLERMRQCMAELGRRATALLADQEKLRSAKRCAPTMMSPRP